MKHTAGLLLLILALPVFAEDPGWREAVAKTDELRLAGRYREAEAVIPMLFQEASKPGRGEQYRAAAYNNAGVIYQELGRCLEGRNSYERALEIWLEAGRKGRTVDPHSDESGFSRRRLWRGQDRATPLRTLLSEVGCGIAARRPAPFTDARDPRHNESGTR